MGLGRGGHNTQARELKAQSLSDYWGPSVGSQGSGIPALGIVPFLKHPDLGRLQWFAAEEPRKVGGALWEKLGLHRGRGQS